MASSNYFTKNNSTGNSVSNFSLNLIDEYGDFFAVKSIQFSIIIQSVFQIVALIYGTIRVFKYKRISVKKSEEEKPVGTFFFKLQVKSHWAISFIWILQFLLNQFLTSEKLPNENRFTSIVNGVFLWPLISLILQYENTHKFSTESETNSHHYFIKFCWNIQLILDIVLASSRIYLWTGTGVKEKSFVGCSLLRIVVLSGISYLGEHRVGFKIIENEKTSSSIKGRSSKGEEDSKIPKSLEDKFSHYRRQWSLLIKYTKLGRKTQFCLFICFATVASDRVIRLYSQIMNKRLLDSMTMEVNGTYSSKDQSSKDSSKFRLEFRWDYLLIVTILQLIEWDITRNLREYLWEVVCKEMNDGTQLLLFNKVQNLSLRWHLAKKSGHKYGIIGYGSNQLPWFLQNLFFRTVPEWLDSIIYIFYVASVYPRVLNSVIFLTTAATLTFHFICTRHKSILRMAKIQADEDKSSNYLEALSNYETVKYFTNEDYEADKFSEALKLSQSHEWNMKVFEKWDQFGTTFIKSIGSFVGSLICYWMIVNNNGLTVGDYHLFGSHLFKFYYPFLNLAHLQRTFKYAMDDLEKMTAILEESPEVQDSPSAQDLDLSAAEITFKDVHFHYVPERKILHGINFTIPPGKTFALVGSTGSGKTTIIRLLFRFYDTTSGSILIDGQDIKNVRQKSLRKVIGVIPQDTVLFHTSIKQNILYGNFNTKNPDEDVKAAAKCACFHDKIETFPDKYDSIVGNRGLMLSGGERQRISIARTVMKNPPILLLDEATSSLDTHTERQIQSTLEEICKNRTTLIIAHRLSTVINADKILVLEEGNIVESGSHPELLSLNGPYAKMWKDQFSSKKG